MPLHRIGDGFADGAGQLVDGIFDVCLPGYCLKLLVDGIKLGVDALELLIKVGFQLVVHRYCA